ncbi:STAS domain-containing protein [Devosia sp. XJ19-1]|uniref:STAS domain-containing protein n=1 Tax=Devosia ureilytica TaxID=2952754 RepID=A0A9Q4ARB3_9HYPH|nr:STAS domain-containing protein [Devosia ureilytica]MCP8884568.1 STAS domain-containing protein [Devosia ureilytica]MCP8888198.1 STAS domain-containing protein [Devosia ureilytica]
MTEERSYTLVLTGDAGIKSAQDVAASLLEAIENHARLEVDTQTLSAADLTTVQTLLSARANAHARQRDLTLLAPLGAPLKAVLDQAGFLSPGQEHRSFWTTFADQPAGH